MGHRLVCTIFQAAWSDVLVAWMHIKATRVFVESVLRFGMPPRFATFMLRPRPNQQAAVRKALADILGKSAVADPYGSTSKMADMQEEGEEYYPYVSFSFTPFAIARG